MKFSYIDDGPNLPAAVFQALGAASTCWVESPAGVFDSAQAEQIGDDLMEEIQKIIGFNLPTSRTPEDVESWLTA